MNILLISTDNSKLVKIGGKHIHQELLERGWKESGHNVFTVYPIPEKFPFLRKIQNRLRVLTGTPKSQVYKDYVNRFIANLQKQLDTYLLNGTQFDVISSQDPISGCAVGRLLKKKNIRIPIVNTLHGYLSLETVNYGYFSDSDRQNVIDFTKELERESAGYSFELVAVDSRIKNYLIDELKTDKKVSVIFNAIDNQRFHPVGDDEQNDLKAKYGYSPEKTVVLIARRMVKKNGIIYGLKTAKTLMEKHDRHDIHFCIAGHGKEKKNLESYVKDNHLENNVKFVGSISHSEIDQYYKMTDFLLMPSTRSDDVEEATSLSMLEGLVCGKVVIATAIGGMKEVINPGENGQLVEDRDYGRMAEFINELSIDKKLYSKIGSQAHSFAMSNHGYKNHSMEFIKIFQNLHQ